MSKRLLLTLPERMHEALTDEMEVRMLGSVQEVTRQIISEHFQSEENRFPVEKTKESSEKESRTCGEFLNRETWGELQQIKSLTDVLGEAYGERDVVQLLVKLWTNIGAIFGFSPESHLSEAEKKSLITFLDDPEPRHTRMRLVVSGLQELIKKDQIRELDPHLKSLMKILLAHIQRNPHALPT
jgi:hypothetical protein